MLLLEIFGCYVYTYTVILIYAKMLINVMYFYFDNKGVDLCIKL